MATAITNLCLVLLHCLGGVLIYLGIFLYPDEENRFQNRIEQWWIRLDDIQKASRSKVAAFMQDVARLAERGFGRLFGIRLFSLRVIPVSIYLSLASVFLLIVIMWPWLTHSGPPTRHSALLIFAFFLGLALAPAFITNRWMLVLWWAIIPATLMSLFGFIAFVFRTRGAEFTFKGIGLIGIVLGWSLFCDLAYIALTRFSLRRVIHIDRVWVIVAVVAGNLLASAIPILSPIYVGLELFKIAPRAGAAIFASLVFNSIDALAGSGALILAIMLLLHRVLWPTIQRPLYAIYRFSPLKQKKWLIRVGFGLLFLPTLSTFEAIKAFIEKSLGA
jgi:hypothetical protein